MAESGKSDRWNSLLETLGVAPSEVKPLEPAREIASAAPAASQVEQPRAVSMLRPEKAKPAPKAKPAGKPPAKSASYWSRIAGALGLESGAVEEVVAEEMAAEQAQPAAENAPQAAEVRQPNSREETVARERQEELPEPPREEFSRRSGRREQGEREQASREQASREQASREREPRERDARERDPRETRERGLERGRQERGGRRGSAGREPLGEERRPAADAVADQRPSRGGGFGSGLEFEPASSRDEDDAPRMREPNLPRQREVDESGSVLDYEALAGEGSDAADLSFEARAERRPGGEEGADEGSGRRRRRRRRGRGKRGASETPVADSAARHDDDLESVGEEVEFEFEREDDLGADSDHGPEAESRDRPGRSSRRSEGEDRPAFGPRSRERDGERGAERGGRSRHREERASRGPSRQPLGYEGEPAPRPEHGGRPPRAASASPPINEDLDADFEIGDDHDEHDEHEGGNLPTHKKIPTWEDAVSVLINANMASRGNSDRDRDRERGRGRGRGRR